MNRPTARRKVAADLSTKPTGLSNRPAYTYRQPVNHTCIHRSHLLLLLSPKADRPLILPSHRG